MRTVECCTHGHSMTALHTFALAAFGAAASIGADTAAADSRFAEAQAFGTAADPAAGYGFEPPAVSGADTDDELRALSQSDLRPVDGCNRRVNPEPGSTVTAAAKRVRRLVETPGNQRSPPPRGGHGPPMAAYQGRFEISTDE